MTDDDYHILQQDLLQLSSWSATWQILFNVKKCAVLSITRKRSPRICEYHLDNDVTPRAKDYKYLGVTVTTDLRWNIHCQNIRHKASRTACTTACTTPHQFYAASYYVLHAIKGTYACFYLHEHTRFYCTNLAPSSAHDMNDIPV